MRNKFKNNKGSVCCFFIVSLIILYIILSGDVSFSLGRIVWTGIYTSALTFTVLSSPNIISPTKVTLPTILRWSVLYSIIITILISIRTYNDIMKENKFNILPEVIAIIVFLFIFVLWILLLLKLMGGMHPIYLLLLLFFIFLLGKADISFLVIISVIFTAILQDEGLLEKIQHFFNPNISFLEGITTNPFKIYMYLFQFSLYLSILLVGTIEHILNCYVPDSYNNTNVIINAIIIIPGVSILLLYLFKRIILVCVKKESHTTKPTPRKRKNSIRKKTPYFR